MNQAQRGWWNGIVGVIIFSGSLPATRAAISDFEPIFLTAARAAIAGLLAACLLFTGKEKRPGRSHLGSLLIVAGGVVIGFPLFTALALKHITAAHSIVFIGLLPLSTAIFAVVRGGERLSPGFWLFACLGSTLVVGFAATQDASASALGDTLMVAAITVCGIGYAEGARLSRTLGGWQVISWALVISLPIMFPLALLELPASLAQVGLHGWIGLAYVSVFSMLIGFVFWYRGLALGGTAAVGQLQLLQPFFGLMLAAVFLHEQISGLMIAASVGTVVCVAGARKFSR